MPAPENTKIYMFSHLRTCSNVFVRLFKSHPDVKFVMYPFMLPGLFGPDRPPNLSFELPAGDYDKLVDRYKDQSIDLVRKYVFQKADSISSEGKVPFMKDHTFQLTRPDVILSELMKGIPGAPIQEPRSAPGYSSTLILTDEFLDSVTPILTIRHPARVMPSTFHMGFTGFNAKVTDASWALVSTFKWQRLLFDWYNARATKTGKKIFVIDGDELVNNAEGIVAQFCAQTGIDPSGVQYSWKAGMSNVIPEERAPEWAHVDAIAESSLLKSSQIEKDPVSGRYTSHFLLDNATIQKLLTDPNITEEARKWTEAYGEDVSKAIVTAVENSMADYEYLKKFSLKGDN